MILKEEETPLSDGLNSVMIDNVNLKEKGE